MIFTKFTGFMRVLSLHNFAKFDCFIAINDKIINNFPRWGRSSSTLLTSAVSGSAVKKTFIQYYFLCSVSVCLLLPLMVKIKKVYI